jgi:integrase
MAKRIEDERGPAGYRDLEFLGMACGWAMGEGLIDENPLASKRARKAMKFEHEVSRPVATREYFDKLMAKADQLPAAFAVLLTLAWHTGRRFSAILVLKWEHIDFDAGTIRWYAGVSPDNKKREHVVHMNQPTRDALKTWGKGKFPKGWIFPSPDDAKEPLGKDGPKKWLRRAETLAELPHVKQGGWHMFRRGWVSARAASGMPLKDIQAAGDWNDFDTMMRSYVHETAEGVKTVATFVA